MNCANSVLRDLTDDQLLDEVKRLAARERVATADLIASLAELDARKLYLGQGYASLFTYCTQALRYSEDAAYSRITAARAAAWFPAILERLVNGDVTLTAVRLLAPHLTPENYQEVLDAADGKSKREVEELVARLAPQPDVRRLVRKVPVLCTRTQPSATSLSPVVPAVAVAHGSRPSVTTPTVMGSGVAAFLVAASVSAGIADDRGTSTPNTTTAAQPSDLLAGDDGVVTAALMPTKARRAMVAPLAPDRYKVQFTVNAETRDRLRRAQELLRHSVPDGDLAAIFDRALVVLLEQLERTKWAATKAKRQCHKERHPRTPCRRQASPAVSRESAPAQSSAVSDLQLVPEHAATPDAMHTVVEREQRTAPRRRSEPSRRIPSAVKRAVWKRDAGQCAFVGAAGRCSERSFLEFHHLVPYADAGEATMKNLELRCRTHHRLEGERWFGTLEVPTDA